MAFLRSGLEILTPMLDKLIQKLLMKNLIQKN